MSRRTRRSTIIEFTIPRSGLNMPTQPLARLLGQVRQTLAAHQYDDAELLSQYRDQRDPAALDALVRKHAPLVLSACRKVLPEADADDVFQATFLILMRDAKAIRTGQSVGSWLYGVAHRLALQAKTSQARRTRLEAKARHRSEAGLPDLTWKEACAALHEELDRLPDAYRLPLLLCYLDGKSRDEAAAELGWSLNRVRGQLERGRLRLKSRLEKRGVALSAGLLAVVVGNSVTASGPSSQLIQSAINAMAGRPSAGARALVHGVPKMMTSIKFAVAAGAVCLGLGFGLGQTPPTADAQQISKDAPPSATPAKGVATDPSTAPTEVTGRVLNADGEPCPNAQITCTAGTKLVGAVLTADKDGRFRLTLTAEQRKEVVAIVASAKGLAPDWAVLDYDARQADLTLRLRPDDVPVTGRIATLENQPLNNITVEVVRIGRVDDLTAWLEKNVRMRKESYWLNEIGLTMVPGNQAMAKPKVTTDTDGKFRITGCGCDRVLTIKVYGPNVEMKFFWVVTRTGSPKEGYIATRDFNHGVYSPEVNVMLAPSRPLVGTVRDSKTGKPVPGVVVTEVNSHIPKVVTDENGRYRLEGVPKKKHYGLNVAGRKGVPYFDHTHMWEADTAGLDPQETNLTIQRGLELTGRVVDKAGRPVRAEVSYDPLDKNPNAKTDLLRVISSDGWRTKPDGTFYLTVWPGKGVINVCADGDLYASVDVEKTLSELGVRSRPVGAVHALEPIDVDESKPETLKLTIALQDSNERKGTVLGPDGKPFTGAIAAGVRSDGPPAAMKSSEFVVAGMGDKSQRMLLFFHEKEKLGALQEVRGTGGDALVVKLQPLVSARGIVRKDDKGPWSGLTVTALPRLANADKYENLPTDAMKRQGVYGLQKSLWWKLTKRTATTDDDGRFRLDNLLPGIDYTLYISDGDLGEPNTLVITRSGVAIVADKANDLGVLRRSESKK
jgi:RNA polymerase sigma factor (sigma-70 family)